MSGLLNDDDPDDRQGYRVARYRLGQALLYKGAEVIVWEVGYEPYTYWVIRDDRSCVLAPEADLTPATPTIVSYG